MSSSYFGFFFYLYMCQVISGEDNLSFFYNIFFSSVSAFGVYLCEYLRFYLSSSAGESSPINDGCNV